VQKFHSDSERLLAVILDREAEKWFKPAKGQFLIFYKSGADHLEYQPDFVAETTDSIHMLEPKAKNQMEDADVLAKKAAAAEWCEQASTHGATCGGKPWKYALIPHDAIAENMTLAGLVAQFAVSKKILGT
jgi:type III restriction enzyme